MTTQLDESQRSSQTSMEADEQEDPTRHLLQTPTSGSEAYNLLLLQEDVRDISLAQQSLEQTMASLQRREMNGILVDQDIRTLRSACLCLRSLRMRVEAFANSIERVVIAQQLQFMKTRVREQPTTTEDDFAADTSCPP